MVQQESQHSSKVEGGENYGSTGTIHFYRGNPKVCDTTKWAFMLNCTHKFPGESPNISFKHLTIRASGREDEFFCLPVAFTLKL